jgi:hypothetical protein
MKVLSLLVMLTVVSCASQNKEELDIQAKTQASEVTDGSALGNSIHSLIQSSKTLTVAQKAELEKIMEVNKVTAEKLGTQSYKLRAVLVNELLSDKINPKQVKQLKKDIQEVEALRLKNTFDTVEKISNIVQTHPDNEQFANHLILIDRAH